MEKIKIKVTEIKMTREEEKKYSEILRSYGNSQMDALADNIKYFDCESVKLFIKVVENGLLKSMKTFKTILMGQTRKYFKHYKEVYDVKSEEFELFLYKKCDIKFEDVEPIDEVKGLLMIKDLRYIQTMVDAEQMAKMNEIKESEISLINHALFLTTEKVSKSHSLFKKRTIEEVEDFKTEIKKAEEFGLIVEFIDSYPEDREKGEEIKQPKEKEESEEIKQPEEKKELTENIQPKEKKELSENIKNKIAELKKLIGLNIEVVGVWVWVSGDTKKHKEELKKLGMKWNSSRLMWFYHEGKYYKGTKTNKSMNELKSIYGTREISEI